MARGPIIGNYASLTVNQAKASRYISERLRTLFHNAVREYVDEIKNRVPVWSGASRLSISQLAAYAGVPIFGPGNHSLVTHTSPRGVPKQAQRQGAGQAAEEFQVDDNARSGKLFMRWKTSLEHFVTNEQYDVSGSIRLINPGPYNIRQYAQDAFRASINKQMAARPFRANRLFTVRRFKLG